MGPGASHICPEDPCPPAPLLSYVVYISLLPKDHGHLPTDRPQLYRALKKRAAPHPSAFLAPRSPPQAWLWPALHQSPAAARAESHSGDLLSQSGRLDVPEEREARAGVSEGPYPGRVDDRLSLSVRLLLRLCVCPVSSSDGVSPTTGPWGFSL